MPFLQELIEGGFHAANWTVAGGYGDDDRHCVLTMARRLDPGPVDEPAAGASRRGGGS